MPYGDWLCGEQLVPSKQRRSLLGIFRHQLVSKLQEAGVCIHDRVSDHDMMENNTTTRPPIGLDWAIYPHRPVLLSDFRRCPALSAQISYSLHVFINIFDSYVEINYFQVEIVVTDKIFRLDVSMRNFVFMKICESLDEAPAESDTTSGTVYIQEPLVGN